MMTYIPHTCTGNLADYHFLNVQKYSFQWIMCRSDGYLYIFNPGICVDLIVVYCYCFYIQPFFFALFKTLHGM